MYDITAILSFPEAIKEKKGELAMQCEKLWPLIQLRWFDCQALYVIVTNDLRVLRLKVCFKMNDI
jgi:hypothetical protein